MPTLSAATLTAFSESLFTAAGLSAEEAATVSRGLVDANLCGHDSHGVIRIMQYLKAVNDGLLVPGDPFTVIRETRAVLVADGNCGFGQVQARRLIDRLAPKARQTGIAAGTLMHCGHIGRLGEYAEIVVAQGFGFLSAVNNHGYGRGVAPPGGTEGRIGTNPLCMAVPTKSEPVVLDIGTSVCAEGKVRVHYNKGIPVPEGWLHDAAGRPTTDPRTLYHDPVGTILPLGGAQAYKGFGIGLLLDMFAGGLSARVVQSGAPSLAANAVLFILLDVNLFIGAEHFLREVSDLAENVKTCPRAEGVDEILLPGDPERRVRECRSREGLPLDDGTWGQLTALAGKLGVPLPA